jgi:hypothetical protein
VGGPWCRQHEEDIRSTATDTSHINQVIQEKDEEMSALKEQIAERKHAEQQAAASAAGASSQSPVKPAADESPHSNMSSPWGTDVSPSASGVDLNALKRFVSMMMMMMMMTAGERLRR